MSVHAAATVPAAPPPAPTARADGSEVRGLDPALLRPAVALRDWLLAEGAHDPDGGRLVAGFAEHLNGLDVPVDRVTTAIDALHSEYSGVGRFWTKEKGSSLRLFPHGEASDQVYARSPFAEVHRTREWLLLDLAETQDDRFSVLPELKAEGYRHYLVVPIFFTTGTANGITLATRDPAGFGRKALSLLRFVMPTFAAALEMRSVNQRLDNVLRIYVGDGPHKAILAGSIRRGEVMRIRSAILFADMRGYTHLSSRISPEGAVELLNAFFDCLVPPIENEGGEILKYMGDGLLAIFRDRGDDTGGAAQAALDAGIGALMRIASANAEGRFATPIGVGVALHHGEAAYGNVGSGARLDFTVIGRDVNLASRLARLNRTLGEPLLMSKPFADHLWGNPEPMGLQVLDGFDEPVAVYRPRL